MELNRVLKDFDDFKLIDTEVYGNLKRRVKLGGNNFIFTPHFLIQPISEVDFKVIKLQNVALIKSTRSEDNGCTEFFDKSNQSLGSINNSAFNCMTFNNICKEQIPWAEVR